MLLSSLDDVKNFIKALADGSLNPGHGDTNLPSILYGRGKHEVAEAALSLTPL